MSKTPKTLTLTANAILQRAAALRQEAEFLERLAREPLAATPAAIEPKPASPRLSQAARRRISEATRKRWSAYRAQKATTPGKPARLKGGAPA